jgi:hypothetical protein
MKIISMAMILAGVALSAPALAQLPKDPIEDEHYGWSFLAQDLKAGIAVFITPASRAGNAVHFHIFQVFRDVQDEEFPLDKELWEALGDCQSRKVEFSGHRYQAGDETTPPPVLWPSPTPATAVQDLALTAACSDTGSSSAPIEAPYSWAKKRLRETAQ